MYVECIGKHMSLECIEATGNFSKRTLKLFLQEMGLQNRTCSTISMNRILDQKPDADG